MFEAITHLMTPPLWCHALVLPASSSWGLWWNLILFSKYKMQYFRNIQGQSWTSKISQASEGRIAEKGSSLKYFWTILFCILKKNIFTHNSLSYTRRTSMWHCTGDATPTFTKSLLFKGSRCVGPLIMISLQLLAHKSWVSRLLYKVLFVSVHHWVF